MRKPSEQNDFNQKNKHFKLKHTHLMHTSNENTQNKTKNSLRSLTLIANTTQLLPS